MLYPISGGESFLGTQCEHKNTWLLSSAHADPNISIAPPKKYLTSQVIPHGKHINVTKISVLMFRKTFLFVLMIIWNIHTHTTESMQLPLFYNRIILCYGLPSYYFSILFLYNVLHMYVLKHGSTHPWHPNNSRQIVQSTKLFTV
jgi:hypothetical protein